MTELENIMADCHNHSADRTYHWCVDKQTPCNYPDCDNYTKRKTLEESLINPKHIVGCAKCGKEIAGNIYGNMCRTSESYCKECYDKLDKKEKDLIDWHFSCDWF
jgi:hypothetical protein